MMTSRMCKFALAVLLLVTLPLLGQQKPLTNEDIVAMVKNHMAESVVVSAIQSSACDFNTSASELIRLKKLGVTDGEMSAMIAAGNKAAPSANTGASDAAAGPGAPSGTAVPASKSRMPKVYVMQGSAMQELPLEKTQLAETKAKPSSMSSLAADSAVTQAMQAGLNTATYSAAAHMNSGVGGTAVSQAGSVFSGIMSHRKQTITYVWGVPNPASSNVIPKVLPTFTVDFSRVPGINSADYEPAIAKLTPAQNTCRIVGATQGKEDARSSPAADWQIYSHFLEELVPVKNEKLASGQYKITPAAELFPGEYAVVLRPVAKAKAFSGGDVARTQGDGLMFDAVWTFQIADSAE
jgi:hypothetical protein